MKVKGLTQYDESFKDDSIIILLLSPCSLSYYFYFKFKLNYPVLGDGIFISDFVYWVIF